MKVYVVESCEEFSETWHTVGVFTDRDEAVEWKRVWESQEGADMYWDIEEWEVQ